MLVPAGLFGFSLYELAFKESLDAHRLTGAEFQQIVSEHKNAKFTVMQDQNGSKTLLIRLPGSQWRVTLFAPADDAILALLAENHISYESNIFARDLAVLGMRLKRLVFLSFLLAPAGGVMLLTKPWRLVAYQQQTAPQKAEKPDLRARNAFRAFAIATALALIALASLIGLGTRWGTRTVAAAELPKLITEYKFAQYVVSQYDKGRSELLIAPRGGNAGPFVATADAASLALLQERGIPYHTFVQGKDFGFSYPTPSPSLICIVLLTTGAALLLWWSGKGTPPWSPAFRVTFLVVFLLVFGASSLLWRVSPETYASTARVQVAQWSNPAFPQDESALI
jgi:hypothetical protein